MAVRRPDQQDRARRDAPDEARRDPAGARCPTGRRPRPSGPASWSPSAVGGRRRASAGAPRASGRPHPRRRPPAGAGRARPSAAAARRRPTDRGRRSGRARRQDARARKSSAATQVALAVPAEQVQLALAPPLAPPVEREHAVPVVVPAAAHVEASRACDPERRSRPRRCATARTRRRAPGRPRCAAVTSCPSVAVTGERALWVATIASADRQHDEERGERGGDGEHEPPCPHRAPHGGASATAAGRRRRPARGRRHRPASRSHRLRRAARRERAAARRTRRRRPRGRRTRSRRSPARRRRSRGYAHASAPATASGTSPLVTWSDDRGPGLAMGEGVVEQLRPRSPPVRRGTRASRDGRRVRSRRKPCADATPPRDRCHPQTRPDARRVEHRSPQTESRPMRVRAPGRGSSVCANTPDGASWRSSRRRT